MNILIATTSFPDKNNDDIAGKFVMNEAMAYALNGMNVTVLTPHQPGARKRESIGERLNVIRFRYFRPEKYQCLKTPNKPIYGQKSIFSILQLPGFLLVFILQLLKYGRWADIIHCQWTVTAFLAMPCRWLYGKTIVMTVRGSDVRLLPKFMNRFSHATADAVLDCYGDQKWNNDNKKDFPANYIKLPLIVERPATIAEKMPQDMHAPVQNREDVFKILYLGRLDSVKIDDGLPILHLLDAAVRLEKSYKGKFHLFYIGDGDSAIVSEIRSGIERLNLKHCVTLLGAKNHVNDYLPFCDLGVGGIAFNAVSQEFSILGKPQLLFEGSYNEETPWRDKVNCLKINAHDADALAIAIGYALENRQRLNQIGENAQEMMGQYVKDIKSGGADYVRAFSYLIKKETAT